MMKSIIVCVNHRSNPHQPSCAARGSVAIADLLESEIAKYKLPLSIERFNCLGFCERGPNLKIVPEGHFIHDVKDEDVRNILQSFTELSND